MTAVHAQVQQFVDVIAARNDPAPITPLANFSSLHSQEAPSINNLGQIAFVARAGDGPEQVFFAGPDGIRLASSIPDTIELLLTDSGRIYQTHRVDAQGNTGVMVIDMSGSQPVVTPLAQPGMRTPLPEWPLAQFMSTWQAVTIPSPPAPHVVANARNQAAMLAKVRLDPETEGSAVVLLARHDSGLVVIDGPGMGSGNFTTLGVQAPAISSAGAIVYSRWGSVTSVGNTTQIVRVSNGAPQVLFSGSVPVAGESPRLAFEAADTAPLINARGDVVFPALVRADGRLASGVVAIILMRAGDASPRVIARTGDAVMGATVPQGWIIREISSRNSAVIGDDGTVVFSCSVGAPTEGHALAAFAAWREDSGLRILARLGDALPAGLPGMIAQGHLFFSEVQLNAHGDIACRGNARVVARWNGSDYLLTPLHAPTMAIEARGQIWRQFAPLSPGTRYISGGSDGRPRQWNNRQQAVVQGTLLRFSGSPVSLQFIGLSPLVPVCDPIDFNEDSLAFDSTDIEALLSVFAGGPCIPAGAACGDLDFNNDGLTGDPTDLEAFLAVYSGERCS